MSRIQHSSYKNKAGLTVIAIIKLLSATLLLALTFGIFAMLGEGVGAFMDHYVRLLHLEIENRLISNIIAKVSGTSSKQLLSVGALTFIYALLYIIEGIGLLLKKQWAEYLTVVATGLLIPLELYEIAKKLNATRIIILVVNVAIVVYLIYRLRADKRKQ